MRGSLVTDQTPPEPHPQAVSLGRASTSFVGSEVEVEPLATVRRLPQQERTGVAVDGGRWQQDFGLLSFGWPVGSVPADPSVKDPDVAHIDPLQQQRPSRTASGSQPQAERSPAPPAGTRLTRPVVLPTTASKAVRTVKRCKCVEKRMWLMEAHWRSGLDQDNRNDFPIQSSEIRPVPAGCSTRRYPLFSSILAKPQELGL